MGYSPPIIGGRSRINLVDEMAVNERWERASKRNREGQRPKCRSEGGMLLVIAIP